jgi:hypothetical protein
LILLKIVLSKGIDIRTNTVNFCHRVFPDDKNKRILMLSVLKCYGSETIFFIQIPFFLQFCIRILLYLQEVPDPVPDPILNIHSFTMPTMLKVFSWPFKAHFLKKILMLSYNY